MGNTPSPVRGRRVGSVFIGTYEHAVDDRGRVAIPALYRVAFAAGGIVRPGPEGCVEVHTQADFDRRAAELNSEVSLRTEQGRDELRDFFADAYPVDLDRQGRILVPQAVRVLVPLEARVFVRGCGGHLEIWGRDRHEARQRARREAPAASTAGAT